MKNYLFQLNRLFFSYIILFLSITLSSSCALKKKKKATENNIETVSKKPENAKMDTISPITSSTPMIEEELQDMGALPTPRMINQKHLDSIKAEKMKQKRKK